MQQDYKKLNDDIRSYDIKKPSFNQVNQLKESISYLDGPFVHFPVLVDVKYLMLLCCGWNRRREKFGLLHIVCKTVQLRAFFERRDQLVSGEQTTQFWCNLQKKTDKKNYSNNSISKCLFDNSGRNRKTFYQCHLKTVCFPGRVTTVALQMFYLPGLVIEHS